MSEVLLEGSLEKCAGSYSLFSRWSQRYFVLKPNKLQYFTTPSLTHKKGEFYLDEHSFVSHESSVDKREFVFCLHARGKSRQELLISAKDFIELSLWENAINAAVEEIKRGINMSRSTCVSACVSACVSGSVSACVSACVSGSASASGSVSVGMGGVQSEAKTRPTVVSRATSVKRVNNQKSSNKMNENDRRIIQKGKLEKCGQRMKTWTTRWFILTESRISYFSDANYSVKKGERILDSYAYVKRKEGEGSRAHLFALYTGIGEVELLMCAPTVDVMATWESCLTSTIEEIRSTVTHMMVDVTVCTSFIKQVAEPIFKISLQTFRASLEEYFHFADIREIYNRIIAIVPMLRFKNKFPESFKKSTFGGSAARLTTEHLETRRKRLQAWLQEVFDLFPRLGSALVSRTPDSDDDDDSISSGSESDDSSPLYEASPVQIEIAKLFGSTAIYLLHECLLDRALPRVDFKDITGMTLDIKRICSESKINFAEQPTPKFVRKQQEDESSRLISLFNDLHVFPSSSSPLTGEDEKQGFEDESSIIDNFVQGDEVPSSIDELYQFNIIKLGEFCRKKNINFTDFKTKKQYIRSLIQKSSNSSEGYLQKKDARAEVRKLMSTRDSSVTVRLVDTIWGDLLRRLGVDNNRHSALMYSYNTDEKLSIIAQTITVWNEYVQFSKEDYNLICHINIGRSVNSLLLLAIKVRIKKSTMKNQWVQRFCEFRGVSALLTVLHTHLAPMEGKLIETTDAADILQVLYCFRVLVSSDCLVQVLNTPGVLTSLSQCILLIGQYNIIATQALEILAEIIIYSGESSTLWRIKHEFEQLANAQDERVYQVLISAIEDGDSSMQSAVLIFLNCMFIYDGDIDSRIRMRNDLMYLDFEIKCSFAIRKFSADTSQTTHEKGSDDHSRSQISNFKAEDGKTIVTPSQGVMVGFLTRVDTRDHYEGVGMRPGTAGTMTSGGSWLNITNSSTSKVKNIERGVRNWFVLKSEGLYCESAVNSENIVLRLSDVVEILKHSYYPSQPNRFNFMVLDKYGDHMCFEVDTEDLRDQWCIALRAAHVEATVLKRAYDYPDERSISPGISVARFQQNFEIHYDIYLTLAREDEISMYATGFSTTTSSADLSSLLLMEFRRNKAEGHFKAALVELVEHALLNFAPRSLIKDDKPHRNMRLAVESNLLIPQAPPLPYIPKDKPRIGTSVKLKQLYWTKIKPVNVANTIWQGVEEPDIDLNLLTKSFEQKTSKLRGNKSASDVKKHNESKSVSLFTSNRVQNVAIASAKLKKSPEEIVEIVIALDPDELTQDTTEIVKNLLIPTTEELKVIENYKGDIEELDFTGKLFKHLSGIDRLQQRLTCQSIMLNWQDGADMSLAQLKNMVAVLAELNYIECVDGLKTLFATTLAIGNYMNGGGIRGQAHGFGLDLLLKLKTVRATEGRGTLLHFIAAQMRAAYPTQPLFYANWDATWKSGKLNMKNVELVMVELHAGISYCEDELEAAAGLVNGVQKDALVDRIEAFLMEASQCYEEICQLFEQVKKNLVKTQLFIGDSLSNNPNEDALQKLFTLMLHVAEAHGQAEHDISEWKRQDTKSKAVKYTKRTHRVASGEGSTLIAAHYSLRRPSREKPSLVKGSGGGSGSGQSEMLRQMKEQMTKMRQKIIANDDDSAALLSDDDEDSDDLL